MSSPLEEAVRPAVSGSMAGHCRMAIWLAGHGTEQEPILPNVQRTFDLGHIAEKAMFDQFTLSDGTVVGPWWPEIGEITDHSTGEILDTRTVEVMDRQKEVRLDDFVGHIDGAYRIDLKTPKTVIDVKTMPGLTWGRNLKDDLCGHPFSREYVMQMHFYMEAGDYDRAVLVCFNKENSKIMARFIEKNDHLVKEVRERLSWAKSGAEPTPDWVWDKGCPIPLRCGYCGFKEACAETRGLGITLRVERGSPKWIVS